MPSLRINISGRLLKPISPAIQTKLIAAKAVIADAKTYCQKINEGRSNEEQPVADYDNQVGWIDFKIDLSIPENLAGTLVLSDLDPMTGLQVGGIKIASDIVPKLADLRTKVSNFEQYLTKTDDGELKADVFICHHDSNGVQPDEQRFEV